ncbi:hypothetical protein Q8A67_018870 [Cirrhinus molitorella]|uniref:Uncharacterized protein n=1 Tax=Cirrhinus molitorella TaxID=172907 RepID=A0AA88PH40_9TELE|nr:hypothetical protein Q8A67_018870 [Cirrhinus molitorella]
MSNSERAAVPTSGPGRATDPESNPKRAPVSMPCPEKAPASTLSQHLPHSVPISPLPQLPPMLPASSPKFLYSLQPGRATDPESSLERHSSPDAPANLDCSGGPWSEFCPRG